MEKDVSKLCGGIAQILRNFYRTAYVKKSSQAGAKLLGHPYRSILKQNIPPDTDVVIFGGGANDLMACGFGWDAIQCHKKTMHRIVLPNLKAGRLKMLIDKSVPENALVIIVYQTVLPDFAKPAWERLFGLGAGDKLRDRYREFASANQNIIWIDVGEIVDQNNRNHWLIDGVHPSLQAYYLVVKRIVSMIDDNL